MRSVVWGACALAVVVGTAVFAARAGPAGRRRRRARRSVRSPRNRRQPTEKVEVPPPPFSDGIFPCSACHNADMPANRTRRELTEMHTDIVLKHDEEHRWCLDCHDADNRDFLHLASGERVPFDESYRLCGQCHGEKYRDWRAGVHGRRSGSLERPQDVPAVRALPQPAPAALQAPRAEAGARSRPRARVPR